MFPIGKWFYYYVKTSALIHLPSSILHPTSSILHPTVAIKIDILSIKLVLEKSHKAYISEHGQCVVIIVSEFTFIPKPIMLPKEENK